MVSGSVLFYLPYRVVQGEESHSVRRWCDSCPVTAEEESVVPGKGQESWCQCLR